MKLSAPSFLEMWLESLEPAEQLHSSIEQAFVADATDAGYSEEIVKGIVAGDLATYLTDHRG